VINVAENIH